MRLVADVGGTNVRIGLIDGDGAAPTAISKLRSADFDSLQAALGSYIDAHPTETISEACIAVAGPVNADRVKLTNLPWEFSQTDLQRSLQVKKLAVMNDFAAIALAIPHLSADDRKQIGTGHADSSLPIAAIGPGTGLGSAMLVTHNSKHTVIPAEAGHAAIAAETDIEHAIVKHFSAGGAQINREYLLSGGGLRALHGALNAIQNADAPRLSPAEIQQHACNGSDAMCVQALSIFCSWLGGVCADQALVLWRPRWRLYWWRHGERISGLYSRQRFSPALREQRGNAQLP